VGLLTTMRRPDLGAAAGTLLDRVRGRIVGLEFIEVFEERSAALVAFKSVLQSGVHVGREAPGPGARRARSIAEVSSAPRSSEWPWNKVYRRYPVVA